MSRLAVVPLSALLFSELLVAVRAGCDEAAVEVACRGWSDHQRPVCRELERVKCCIRGGASQGSCCSMASAQMQGLPLCRPYAATVQSESLQCGDAMEAACEGCTGEGCTSCHEEQQVGCCLRHGGSNDLCCPAHSAGVRAQSLCQEHLLGAGGYKDAQCEPGTAEAACHGCSGEACQLCREEEEVRCCQHKGGSRDVCCAAANPQVQARPVCRVSLLAATRQTRCDPKVMEAACRGCGGYDCHVCREEQDVHCCIDSGGSTVLCCDDASAEVRARPLCQASAEVWP